MDTVHSGALYFYSVLKANEVKKIAYLFLPALLCLGRLSAQTTCTVVDSLYINAPSTDTEHIKQANAIAFSGGYLWIAATSTYDRSYFVDSVYIYKYSTSGVRLDSIGYIFGTGEAIVNMTADANYIWALKLTTDSLYKFNISSKTLAAVYPMGGRGTADLGHTMASIGDTLYFLGSNTGQCFKFKKSTEVFADEPTFAAHTGAYPSGMCSVGDSLVITTQLDLAPVSFDNVSVVKAGTMKEDVSSRANWCIDIPDGLTYGAGCFWQLKSTFLFFDIRNSYVYKVQSGLSAYSESVNSTFDAGEVAVTPNPAHDNITIKYPISDAWNSFTINLYCITGAHILSRQVSGSSGKASIDISELDLPAGLYILQMSNGTQQLTRKISIY